MTNSVCNAVTHTVSCEVTDGVRTTVQNQNQNQRFWLQVSCGCWDETKSNLTASYGLLGLEPMA